MSAFLFDTLDEASRLRIVDRLTDDETLFEELAAFEDDLILRWHKGELSDAERAQFAAAYNTPARRARIDEVLSVLRIVDADDRTARRSPFQRPVPAAAPPPRRMSPAWAIAATFVAGVSLAAAYWSHYATARAPFAPGPVVLEATLTATGEKGAAPTSGFDVLFVSPQTKTVQLTVNAALPSSDGALKAEISNVDRTTVVVTEKTVRPSANGPAVTISVAADSLPDGDYVLRVVHETAAGSTTLARQAFRVTRR